MAPGHPADDVRLVLIRHGESAWNAQARFAGWVDIDLTALGAAQAHYAGQALAASGWRFDLAFTSSLVRSIRTHWAVADEMKALWVPVVKDWRLNERHYGALTGLSKIDALKLHGEDMLDRLRFGFRERAAPLISGPYAGLTRADRYRHVAAGCLPLTESVDDTARRVEDFWRECIGPALMAGKRILICAHGTSLRALVRRFERVPDEQVTAISLPNGVPLMYAFNSQGQPVSVELSALPMRRVELTPSFSMP
jgi:2,3-bisphosphoglycerate-dependent phosphoglycerate mutase